VDFAALTCLRRRNPLGCLCRPLFCRFDRLAVENRRRGVGLLANPLAQGHVQLGPDRLPDATTLELAKDVVDRFRAADSARDTRCAENREWRSSLPACRSCAVARPATPPGSAVPAAPTPHPSDHSDNPRPLADKADAFRHARRAVPWPAVERIFCRSHQSRRREARFISSDRM
jgi:hypothetical protein